MISNDSHVCAYKLVLFDVDGVLTDGTLFIGANGETVKPFNAKDGFAISLLQQYNIQVGVLSGKDSEALRYRCKQLKIEFVLVGIQDKLAALSELLEDIAVDFSEVCYVGDDVNDICVMKRVGKSFAPKDAHQLVLSLADEVCLVDGGRGVARDVAESLLLAAGVTLAELYSEVIAGEIGCEQ